MPIDDEILRRARKSDRAAVETVAAECYPTIHRVAHALTGDPVLAQRVLRVVLHHGVRVMPNWRKGIIPENWFYHHTLLTARQTRRRPPPPDRDLLVTAGPSTEPAYAAFIRALRSLPGQQMEAFVLHHGEKLNPRLLGVAMDCSTLAATNHLTAATTALAALAGENFDVLTAAFERAYQNLTPPETVIHGTVRRQVGSLVWRRRIRRLVRRLVLLAILAAIAYLVWRWHSQLLQWYHDLRARMTAAPPGPTTKP